MLKTVNGGTSWETISPDLTQAPEDKKDPKKTLGSLMTIAPSPVMEGVIWAGTDDGAVQLTRDSGATWQNVTPSAVSEWSAIPLIEAYTSTPVLPTSPSTGILWTTCVRTFFKPMTSVRPGRKR